MARSAVLLAVAVLIAVTDGAIYLGCFREKSIDDRLFKGDFQNFTSTNTPEFCVENCRSKGFDFAGVQFGKQCFCTNERPSFESLARRESQCNMPCSGDPDQVCGGHMRMNVYSLVDASSDSLALSYVGCHPGGALSEEVTTGSALTLDACKQSCEMSNYRYFGAERGSRCFCGNNIHTERVSEQECRVPCQGDTTQLCGGPSRLSVYRSSVPDPTNAEEYITTTTEEEDESTEEPANNVQLYEIDTTTTEEEEKPTESPVENATEGEHVTTTEREETSTVVPTGDVATEAYLTTTEGEKETTVLPIDDVAEKEPTEVTTDGISLGEHVTTATEKKEESTETPIKSEDGTFDISQTEEPSLFGPESVEVTSPTSTTIETTMQPETTTTARPVSTTTALPLSTTSTRPTTARPVSTATQTTTTARPVTTTSQRPQPSTTARPVTTTSQRPEPSTSRPVTTTSQRPEPSTSRPVTTTSQRPQPSTTARPVTTTSQRPQPSTTARPVTMTTVRPRPTPTSRPITTTKKPKKNKKSSSSSSSSSEEKKYKNKKNKHSSKNVAVEYSSKGMGCYKDAKTTLLPDYMTELTFSNSPQACVELCGELSYNYAGVQRHQCFCSKKKPDKKHETRSTQCFTSCPGDANEICGGRGTTSVFEIKA